MKALVTGASGFIGSHIVDSLLDAGHQVRALVRATSDTSYLEERGVPLAVGDVTRPESLGPACEGIDWVFHTAAVIGSYGTWDHYRDVGVRGTRNMIKASSEAGAERFIHLSSIAVYGTTPRDSALTEDEPLDEQPEKWNHYGREKVRSEKLVWKAHREGRVKATAFRPSVVLGARDLSAMPRTLSLVRSPLGSLVGDGSNRIPVVVVDEIAQTIVEAASSEVAIGRAYNLSGRDLVTQVEFGNMVADAAGLKRKTGGTPEWLVMATAAAVEGAYRLLRRENEPFVTRMTAVIAGRDVQIDCSRAREELGWEGSADYSAAVERSVRWVLERERESRST